MDSVILNQSLEIYVQTDVAVCRLPTETTEALSLLSRGWSDVVVLDKNDLPLGLFNARCLLSWQSETDGCQFAAPSIALADIDLEPLPMIAASMTVTDFLQRISEYQHSAETWAVVDSYGRFMSLLQVSQLLRSLIQSEQEQNPTVTSLLLPLIYQLPLPVIVSDRNGAIVGMNSAWRNSLHESLPINVSDPAFPITESVNGSSNGHVKDSTPLLPSKLPTIHEFCTTDGQSFTWQVINVSLQGDLDGLNLAIAYDISAQKELAQELSGLRRVKDEFLTCVNHELKSPLTSVIGIASLLSNQTFGKLNDRQSRYVNMIRQSGQQLVSIIDNIFDLAKAESGQLDLYAEEISVKVVCERSIQQVKKLVQQDSSIFRNYQFKEGWELNIKLDIDPTVVAIYADEARLQQMLVNLLVNAFKFSFLPSELVDDSPPPIPQIGLIVKWWEGWLAITVWDQGIGIPEEKQCLIFQKFQQVENVLTRRFEGTGSSLLLTRHLARLHGGDITFISQVDVGSEFTVLLPTQPNSAETIKVDRRLDNGRSRLILIVETCMEVLDWLRHTLAELAYKVVIARSGTEALEKARRLQPCLILLSPDMPMLSGWDVLALLKGDQITQHIRVVMMKRAGEPKTSPHPSDGVLTKPIKVEDLRVFLPEYISVPKSLKLFYLNQNLDNIVIELLQDLGHCLLEMEDLSQCGVLSKIWHPDLFLIDGDRNSFLEYLEHINKSNNFARLPILIITKSAIAEIDWLRNRFTNLNLYGCLGLDLENIEMARSDSLSTLTQSLTDAMCYVLPHPVNV